MSLDIFEFLQTDSGYQNIVNEFNSKKNLFDEMVRQGIYNKEHLQKIANQLVEDLRKNIIRHRRERMEECDRQIKELEAKKQSIGYVERQAEAKEFEIRFAIADDYELKSTVDNLTSTDLLELSLLRMELKKRGMGEEANVKMYVDRHGLDGMDGEDRKKYDRLREEKRVYMGHTNDMVIIGHELFTLSSIQSELNAKANSVPDNQTVKRPVSAARFSF